MHKIIRKESNRRMSRAVVYNDTVYLCGQVAKEMIPDVKVQTQTTLEKIDELLEGIGSNRNNILTGTVYLKNMSDFSSMNEVWESWISTGHAPARTCVEAKMSKSEILVEITIVAAIE